MNNVRLADLSSNSGVTGINGPVSEGPATLIAISHIVLFVDSKWRCVLLFSIPLVQLFNI